MKTLIFLGAGASASDGVPVQSAILREYFKTSETSDLHSTIKKELRNYFKKIFNIDVESSKLEEIEFPTFEEAIGMLDLAEIRNEAFKDFNMIGVESNSGQIQRLRIFLIHAMATVIKEKAEHATWHRSLIKVLKSEDLIANVSFITTNYDILIDNSLAEVMGSQFKPGTAIDYGVEFTNHEYWGLPDDEAINLYKLHGSLNWLHCSVCNDLNITPFQKGAAQIADDPEGSKCRRCNTVQSPIIVPPTFYKNISNIYLATIWKKVEDLLRDIDHIIFCGYSFPEADTHIKYLLKRAETNRENPGFDVTVLNWHRGKTEEEEKIEKQRYERFFLRPVKFKKKTFENFAAAPEEVIKT